MTQLKNEQVWTETSPKQVYKAFPPIKHVNRHSASQVVVELHIKTMWYCDNIYWNSQHEKYWRRQRLARAWSNRNSNSPPVGMQHSCFQRQSVCFSWSQKRSYQQPQSLATQSSNPTPLYLHKWAETCVHAKICTQMFKAALFRTPKLGSNPRYPSIDEKTNCVISRHCNIIQH